MISTEVNAPAFLKGGGEMGERIRSKDWSTTPIGNPESWPPSLRTSVSILLNSQFPMFVWWGPGLTTLYNDAYRPVAGEKHPALLGRPGREAWAEIWHDLGPLVERVFSGTSTWSEDQVLYMNRHGYVEETYFTFSYSPVLDESGAVGGLFCACIETTEKVQATRRLQESERNLRNTILQSPVAMCILKGPSFVVEIANERMYELWGRGGSELECRPIFAGIPEFRHQGLEELLQKVYTTGEAYRASEHRILVPRDGGLRTIYANFVYEPFRDVDGAISGILAVATDVTEQVEARHKVEQSERNFRRIVSQSPVAMCILLGPDHRVDLVNDAMLALWDKTAPEVLQRPVFEGVPEARHQGLEELLANVYRSGVAFTASERPVELRRHGRLETVYQNFVYEPYRDAEGAVLGVLAITIDVTDQVLARHKIEEVVVQRTGELAQANEALTKSNQELKRSNASLEEFAYAASHDMKEPIRKIHFFADRLKGELEASLTETQRRLFERLEHASRRMGTLIDDLLTYSQAARGAAEQDVIDLNKKVRHVLEDLELEVQQKNATLSVDPLPTVKGNRRQFQQLFQNLISNALKYHKPGVAPHIHITAQKVQGAGVKTDRPMGAAQWFHLIEVRDNGIGFEQENAERIFNMFTRLHGNAEYRGTGVGLSIVRKVVENHDGHIWAESAPGEGATFRIALPVK